MSTVIGGTLPCRHDLSLVPFLAAANTAKLASIAIRFTPW
jgi:hypothetical protein